MSELNRLFTNILLGYMSDDGCHLTREDCNELSKFIRGIELEVYRLKNEIASAPVHIAAEDTIENKRLTAELVAEREAHRENVYIYKNVAEGLTSELAKLREAGRWVPVGERLPVGGLHVEIVLGTPARNVSNGFYQSENGIWIDLFNGYDYPVTHWRPLPSAPSEVEG